MSSRSLRIASVGYGRYFRQTYLPVLRQRGLSLAAVYLDSSVGSNDKLGTDTAREKGKYERAKAELKDDGIVPIDTNVDPFDPDPQQVDGMIISAFHTFHYQLAEKCLERNTPVLLEKPPVSAPYCSSKEKEASRLLPQMVELVRLARENECLLVVGVQRRYEEPYQWVRTHIENLEGDLRPKHVNVLNVSDRPQVPDGKGWTVRPRPSGGGKLMQTGYHYMDIVPWFWKDKIDSVDVTAELSRYLFTAEQIGEKSDGNGPSPDNVEKSADIVLKLNLKTPETITANLSMQCGGPLGWVREEIRILLEGREGDPEKRETISLDRNRWGAQRGRPGDVARFRKGNRSRALRPLGTFPRVVAPNHCLVF